MAKNPVSKIIDNLPKLKASFASLIKQDVYVGVPNFKIDRKPEPGETEETNEKMNNATLLYIHDKGSPAANIPARPVMEPGIQAAKGKIVNDFKSGARAALAGSGEGVQRALHRAGIDAADSIRGKINDGPPPPLAASTIAARKRRGHESEKTLVESAQMRNAVTHVLQDK